MTTNPPRADETRTRVRSVIEEELGRVRTFEDAEAVLQRAEHLAASKTEEQAGQRAAGAPSSAPAAVEQAEQTAPTQPAGVADPLVEAAAQAVAPTPQAPAVIKGAQEAVGAAHDDDNLRTPPTGVRHGRSLLRQALLRRLGPFQALDARIYLEVNGQPHPRLLDAACNVVTAVTRGGWIWILGTLLAYWLKVPRSAAALRAITPGVLISTFIAEYPIKAYFRRRRPFIDVVSALVVGKEPGSWSFPSGHTCAAFAAASVLSRFWPQRRPVFFGVATMLGCSRVFVGAHYPGDVAVGATLGVLLSELIRRATDRLPGGAQR